jgi:WD40 repeat protein
MLRFIAACTVIAAVCVGAVLLLAKGVPETVAWIPGVGDTKDDGDKTYVKTKLGGNGSTNGSGEAKVSADVGPAPKAPHADDDKRVTVKILSSKTSAQPLVFQDARILAMQRQDVPSERDGKLLFLATPARDGESVPTSKVLEFEVPMLAVPIDKDAWRNLPEEERLKDMDEKDKYYRAVRYSDSLGPRTTVVIRQKLKFRMLDVGDRVKKDQMLGVINPALAMDELFIKQSGVEIADREIKQSVALYDEYVRRSEQMRKLRNVIKSGVTDDDYYAALATATKYKEEAKAKEAGLLKSQRELGQAVTTLKMHTIRASIDGVIKSVYKQPGESVKNLEPVLQIQNPKDLRVEAQVEVQDALALRDRLEEARKWRETARNFYQKGDKKTGDQYVAYARNLLAVEVEASRVEPPRAVLSGHLQDVTCVAVSAGSVQRIVSGSEDKTVRVWERGEAERWEERARLDHFAVVRSVACSPASSKKNLLLTGTATGRGRIFDLDNLKDEEKQITLQERHGGSINAVAFNADATICATGGDDRAICLWETTEGKRIGRVSGAHNAGITSLVFTPKGQVISAGKDRRIILWNVVKDGDQQTLEQAGSFDRRSGEVTQLGIDGDGTHALFDEGREIRVLSLESRKIEGTIANPPGAPSFSTLALYSPDGTTVLTNGNATGRLQLWRAPSAKVRAAELRLFAWSNGNVTSGAFDPNGTFAATGTSDGRVLVWAMPSKAEAEKPLPAQLSYVEEFLDTSLKRVAVRATLENPGWIIPGGGATIVVPPRQSK